MSLEIYEAEKHVLFPTLTAQQKNFVRKYLELGDAVSAVVAVYGDIRRPQAVAARLLRHDGIRQVLKITGELPAIPLSRAEFGRMLSKEMQAAAGTPRFVHLAKVYYAFLESKPKREKTSKKEITVDDLVLQMEKENGQ